MFTKIKIKLRHTDQTGVSFIFRVNIVIPLIKAFTSVKIWRIFLFKIPCENQYPTYQKGCNDHTWIHVCSFVPSILLFGSIVISTIENPRLFNAISLNYQQAALMSN